MTSHLDGPTTVVFLGAVHAHPHESSTGRVLVHSVTLLLAATGAGHTHLIGSRGYATIILLGDPEATCFLETRLSHNESRWIHIETIPQSNYSTRAWSCLSGHGLKIPVVLLAKHVKGAYRGRSVFRNGDGGVLTCRYCLLTKQVQRGVNRIGFDPTHQSVTMSIDANSTTKLS